MPLKYVCWSLLFLISSSQGFAQQPSETVNTVIVSEEAHVTEAPAPAAPVIVSETPAANEKMDALQAQIDSLQKQFKDLKAKEAAPVPPPPIQPAPQVAPQIAPAPPVTPVAGPSLERKKQVIVADDEDEGPHLRKRTQSFSWIYSYQYLKAKDKSSGGSGASTDGNTTTIGIEYARNLSFWEAGIFLNGTRIDNSSSKYTLTELGVLARLNFVENKPGHDFIPYVAGYLGALAYVNDSGSPTYKMAGGSAGLGLGFNWFPFSEIFALNLELKSRTGTLEDDSYPKTEIEIQQTQLNVGWNIYF